MSGMMPGAWPTLRGWSKKQTLSALDSSVPATSGDIPRADSRAQDSFWGRSRLLGGWPKTMDCGQVTATRRLSGTDRCAISSTLRRAALEKMFEPPIPNFSKVEKVENGTKNSISVDEKVVSGQTCNDSIGERVQMLADDGCSSFQGTHGPGADSSTATPDFPDITKASGETDWGKYLAYMEDDMSFEERINNNMLLEGSSIREISANQSLTQLSLDLERDDGRMMLLFKDLPAMRQGKQVGQAMYILGYDLARPDFFLRLFEKLPSTISLLPQHWDFSIEILRLTVGDVLDMLEDNDVVNLSTLHQCILPWWDEELGFKVVILILFGQWILDFDRAFIWEEETKMLRELLVKWRVLLSAGMDGQKEFAHDVEEEVEERQSHVEEVDTKGAQEVAAQDVSKESSLVSHSPEASHISSLVDDGIPQHAPPSLKVPRHRQKDTYDSDEEDEWAALEKWAASKKQESPLKAVNPEQVSETALVAPELSADDNIDPTNAFLTPERVKSPLEIFDLEDPADAKRFSDLSTLCDGCEGNKEKLTFSNTLRNAMLSAGSIEAMTEVYLDFVRKNPEHDSERKRIELLEFLLSHVEEKDGGLLSVEKMLEELKDMGLTEDEAEAAEAERGGSSNRSGKRVSWPCPDCLATPLGDGT